MTRIAHCIHGLDLGGAQQVVKHVVRGSARAGFSSVVYSPVGGVFADEVADADELRRLCVTVLLQAYQAYESASEKQAADAVTRADAFLAVLEKAYTDPQLKRRIYASIIAESNPTYTRGLLDQYAQGAQRARRERTT